MDLAFQQAQACWETAYKCAPDFVERYLELSEQLLLQKLFVRGDEIKAYCLSRGLRLPPALHHNTWVSGVNALDDLDWIIHFGYEEPTKLHNHMNSVSVWMSRIYVRSRQNVTRSVTRKRNLP